MNATTDLLVADAYSPKRTHSAFVTPSVSDARMCICGNPLPGTKQWCRRCEVMYGDAAWAKVAQRPKVKVHKIVAEAPTPVAKKVVARPMRPPKPRAPKVPKKRTQKVYKARHKGLKPGHVVQWKSRAAQVRAIVLRELTANPDLTANQVLAVVEKEMAVRFASLATFRNIYVAPCKRTLTETG